MERELEARRATLDNLESQDLEEKTALPVCQGGQANPDCRA